MVIEGRKRNAREAADEFARIVWEEPREVGTWTPVPDSDRARFQLREGVKWYVVMPHPLGWEVIQES